MENKNGLMTFNHNMFGELKILIKEGKEYFPATEVAKALGYSDPYSAVKQHTKSKGWVNHLVLTNGGQQEKKFISKGNLYRLISRSTLPDAEKFESWIFDELIPTIHETGGYINNTDLMVNTYFGALPSEQQIIIKSLFTNIEEQQKQIAIMKPKTDYFDALVDRNLLTNIRETAKELQVKQKYLVNFLLDNKYVFRDSKKKLKPYAQYVPELFEIKEWAKGKNAGTQTLITPKGRETFRLLLNNKIS
ncbi:phage antirepressor KilAC domain-containing protein [Peribacillus butanolivorans]|uniref:phage antirepressor KilAC domain-containing protein n=1 Tax=Peribacillus butanolivorans TaxID=421767 RepID=UPI00366E499D